MEMQDKEFDRLFNSKLNDFEVEPSPMVWDNIAAELDGKKEGKRSIMPYLSIAASVIVVVAASVLFSNRPVKKDDESKRMVKIVKPVTPLVTRTDDGIAKEAEPLINTSKTPSLNGSVKNQPVVKNTVKSNNTNEVQRVKEIEPLSEKPEPLLASARTDETPLLQPAMSANDVPLNTRVIAATEVELTNKAEPDALVGSASPAHVEAKKRARGLGGLINTVIAAVDKRDDKLIEFADSENDEGTKVASVNLGIFKIKKQ